MNLLSRWALSVLCIGFCSPVFSTQKVVLAADPWCPYNCGAQDAKQGFMLDIARTIFANTPYKIEYLNMPWARAIKLVKDGKIDGLVGASKLEAKNMVISKHSLGLSTFSFFTLPTSTWQYSGLKSLEKVSLGRIKSYSYGGLTNRYIRFHQDDKNRVQTVTSVNGLELLVAMLRKKRVDVIIEDKNVMANYFSSQGQEMAFRNAGTVCDEEVFIAFGQHVNDAATMVKIIDDKLQVLRASGELVKILSAYGVEDWQSDSLAACFYDS